jgi:hypothetical protein
VSLHSEISRPPIPVDDQLSRAGSSDVESGVFINVRQWIDPLVDDNGHDPRSGYVETFWLGVLGPTATWLLRRLAAGLQQHPEGFAFDLAATAAAMGLSFRSGRSSAFSKALQRCVMFGLAHQLPDGGLAVRRRVPDVAHRHLRRMPHDVQRLHHEWQTSTVGLDALGRAHRFAMTMLEVGDDPTLIEPQLRALGVSRAVAEQVADNATRLDVQ